MTSQSNAPGSADEPDHPVRRVVEAYYATVADLGSTPESLAALLADDVRITEHPNLITPAAAAVTRRRR